jgi:photosystem II stability/assembly factor-like uncharacterized protein
VVGFSGIILRTTNGGVNWNLQTSGSTNHLMAVSFTDANNGTAVGFSGTILRTTNGGANWNAQTSGVTAALNGVSFTDANNGTVACESGSTILRTTNGGVNWNPQTSGTNNFLYAVSCTDANNGTVVGSAGTILHTTNGGLVGFTQSNGSEIPNDISLSQNYPNPFNPTTTIKFSLPRAGIVKIVVYDILGRAIETLVNQQLQPGTYEVNWNAANYPSGVYFYRIQSAEYLSVKKMVLIK